MCLFFKGVENVEDQTHIIIERDGDQITSGAK